MFDKLFGGHDEQEQDAQQPEQEESGWTFDTVASIIAPIEDFYLMFLGFYTGSQHGDTLGVKGITFRVPLCLEWTEGRLAALLETYGIQMYHYCAGGDVQLFMVDREDATRTQAVLNAYGVPTVEPGEEIQWKE